MMRNPKATHVNFKEFIGVIPNTKMLPSNVDMIMEHRGCFLIGEWKRDGEYMGLGQEILLKQLAKVPYFTVLVITGNTDDLTLVEKVEIISADGKFKTLCSTFKQLKEFIVRWYKYSEER
jgi:hypothetical protein